MPRMHSTPTIERAGGWYTLVESKSARQRRISSFWRTGAKLVTSQKQGVSVAVVGQFNAGKTSLMRKILLRDSHFGNVANTARTTRHVEGGALVTGQPALRLYDTPGLKIPWDC